MNKKLEKIMLQCEKPGRYVGGELNTPDMEKEFYARFCMCFPDNYEVAMSNLGIKILYHMLNDKEGVVCERCFAPWDDFGRELKNNNIELFSLETRLPLKEFDFLGFSFQYELSYSNMLYMLDLANIPRRSKDRDESYPLIIGGGPTMCNPLPIADFCDIISIGEGEEVLATLMDEYKTHKLNKGTKKDFLKKISTIQGLYIPSLKQKTVKKTIVKDLDKSYYPTKILVPNIDIVHDRGVIELFRGCTRGCRFCQAGMIYRPIRERSVETVTRYAKEILDNTGYDELSLNSLSTGDYSKLNNLIETLGAYAKEKKVQLALPSLRLDSFTATHAESSRKSSLTFAPEAGTQRLRNVINKNITDQDFDDAITESLKLGFTSLKLYFMIGLPTETQEDLDGIVEMCKRIKGIASKLNRRNVKITVSCATFIPKPFTPFQWSKQNTREEIHEKHIYLSTIMKKNKINFRYHDMKTSMLEVVMARGDKKLSKVIEKAVDMGAKFDGWSEFFNFELWQKAFEDCGIKMEDYTREYALDEELPWNFVDLGVSEKFLKLENKRAFDEVVTTDCRTDCKGCGFKSFEGGVC